MSTAVDIVASYEQLPPRAGAAARVLQLVDDPDAGAGDVAKAIGTDPTFAARVLALANSAYYGLSGRVGTLSYAVSVVGFQALRSLAVAAAAGLDKPGSAPAGYWQQAATCATGADLLAPMLGANPGDAFSLGLLHTLGSALLHQHHPLPALCLPYPDDLHALAQAELDIYGIGHAEAGARVLAAWRFPERLCTLIESHHEAPLPDASAVERTLHGARALTHLVLSERPDPAAAEHALSWMSEGRLDPPSIEPLVAQLRERSAALLEGLLPR
jgi:HD-like signal output (HDOD) protein